MKELESLNERPDLFNGGGWTRYTTHLPVNVSIRKQYEDEYVVSFTIFNPKTGDAIAIVEEIWDSEDIILKELGLTENDEVWEVLK